MCDLFCGSFGSDVQTGHLLAIGGEDGHIAIIDTTVRTADTTITRKWTVELAFNNSHLLDIKSWENHYRIVVTNVFSYWLECFMCDM